MEEDFQTSQINEVQKTDNQKPQEEPGLGIASFVLSLWGMNVLALIFGIISLNKKNSRRTAKTGVIIASIRLGLRIIIAILLGIFSSAWIHSIIESNNTGNNIIYQENEYQNDESSFFNSDIERDITRRNDLSQIQTAIITFQQDRGVFPAMETIRTNTDDTAIVATNGISIETISDSLKKAGMSSIPTDPNESNKVYGLGNINESNPIYGNYIYMVSTRNSVHNAGFILMAAAETEDKSNWVVCENAKDLQQGYIEVGTELRTINICREIQKGDRCYIDNDGLCTYTDKSELRMILLY